MIYSVFYFLLALLGLGILIFIHELGHYWMARKVGMRVETFAIGLGKPVYSWKKDETTWQIGWIPFGGYVRIAGTDTTAEEDPYQIKDGFFGQSPWARIKVAFAGPLANLLVALALFTLLWFWGGRDKSFSEYTKIIGWIDPTSELYAHGVRPGDEILSYNDASFEGARDHIYGPMTSGDKAKISGLHVNYETGETTPFEYNVDVYPHPAAVKEGIKTAGILGSANYVIYDEALVGGKEAISENAPIKNSGIENGDRIIWVDGEVIYSRAILEKTLNDRKALLTVVRGNQIFLRRAPHIEVQELKLDRSLRDELTDWQYEANLRTAKLQDLYIIPYNLTNACVVEEVLSFIDPEMQKEYFRRGALSEVDSPLEKGDKIIAVDGRPVEVAYELFAALQQRFVNVIVERDSTLKEVPSWENADKQFLKGVDWKALKKMSESIGTAHPIVQDGELVLLHTVQPKTKSEILTEPEERAMLEAGLLAAKKQIEEIDSVEKRQAALKILEQQQKQLLLGAPIRDRKVLYNPGPWKQFQNVSDEVFRTLEHLFSGALSPKFMSGPVGIVKAVQDNAKTSVKDALFMLGAISLNLGLVNLLPIPVLDGGHILIALIEMVTGRRMKPKELERLIIPFAILLMGFFVFLTYNDLMNLF